MDSLLLVGSDTNLLLDPHTVKAKVTNGAGPVEGVTVLFTVAGPNSAATGFGDTNSSGEVSFTYDNTAATDGKKDTITACVDIDGTPGCDTGDTETAMKSWVTVLP